MYHPRVRDLSTDPFSKVLTESTLEIKGEGASRNFIGLFHALHVSMNETDGREGMRKVAFERWFQDTGRNYWPRSTNWFRFISSTFKSCNLMCDIKSSLPNSLERAILSISAQYIRVGYSSLISPFKKLKICEFWTPIFLRIFSGPEITVRMTSAHQSYSPISSNT